MLQGDVKAEVTLHHLIAASLRRAWTLSARVLTQDSVLDWHSLTVLIFASAFGCL